MESSPEINELFNKAREEGTLSDASMAALNVIDVGDQILAAMGTPAFDAPASEMVLVTMLVDDSGSIRFARNADLIREGHNMVLEALKKTQQKDSIMVHTRYLNGFVLYPYSPVPGAVKMTKKNYDPNLGTPLYDQAVTVLGTVLAKAQSFADNGIPVRTITLILTDGADAHSVRSNERSVAAIVRDMLKAENHIIAGMGVEDGDTTDFRKVFKNMGIEDQWILTPGRSEQDIRQAFHLFSRSVVRASQAGAPFGSLSLGGFGS
jgi:hypothetical protein